MGHQPPLHLMQTSCILILLGVVCVSAQQTWPITGQGVPPSAPAGRTIVHADIAFDSIEGIHSDRNAFTAIIWFHFSWQDPRALGAITQATGDWFQNSTSCQRMCDSTGHASGGCCDGVWLPHVDLPNLAVLSQEAVYNYRIWVQPAVKGSFPPASDIVHWSVKVTAEFHSPFDFRAWPFEHQHLLIEMQLPAALSDRVSLVLGDVSFGANTPHTKGEVVPGWFVAKTTKRLYDLSACYNKTSMATSYFSFNGTVASYEGLFQDQWAQLSTLPGQKLTPTTVAAGACQNIISAVDGSGALMNPESLSLYNPQIIVVDIMVRRVKDYYLLSNIIPQLLLAYMVFVTYAMERSDLESRMGVVVTLVLAASALQFTWDFPPANYLNAVQQITLASYVMYFVVAVESMVASHICRMHERRRKQQQIIAVLQPNNGGAASGTIGLRGGYSMPYTPGAQFGDGSEFGDYKPSPSFLNSIPSVAEELPENMMQSQQSQQQYRQSGSMLRGRNGLPIRSNGRLPSRGNSTDMDSDWGNGYGNGQGNRRPGPIGEGNEPDNGFAFFRGDRASSDGGSVPGNSNSNSRFLNQNAPGFMMSGGSDLENVRPAGLAKITVATAEKPSNKKNQYLKRSGNKTMSMRLSGAAKTTKDFSRRISRDEAFAQLIASRLDIIFCWSLLLAYTVVVAVLLYINSEVGDHKLMLQGDKPMNM